MLGPHLTDQAREGQVFIPTSAYNGQKLIRLVRRKTADKTISTMPRVPETVPVAYKAMAVMASTVRTMRSVIPMFFFISG